MPSAIMTTSQNCPLCIEEERGLYDMVFIPMISKGADRVNLYKEGQRE